MLNFTICAIDVKKVFTFLLNTLYFSFLVAKLFDSTKPTKILDKTTLRDGF